MDDMIILNFKLLSVSYFMSYKGFFKMFFRLASFVFHIVICWDRCHTEFMCHVPGKPFHAKHRFQIQEGLDGLNPLAED